MVALTTAFRRGGLLGLVGAMTLLLSGCIVIMQPALKEKARTQSVTSQTDAPLRVVTTNGRITVRQGGTDTVTIASVVRAETDERAEATAVVAERKSDGTLDVRVSWPNGERRSSEGCSLDITIPSAKGVSLETGNGAIELTGLSGGSTLRTSNGKVKAMSHSGSVAAATSNGAVDVIDAGGDVDVQTSNGAVTIEKAPGKVVARTSNGAVTVTQGDNGSGPIEIRSSNGRVRLGLSSAFAGTLTVSTSNGGVSKSGLDGAKVLSQSKNAMTLQVGEAKSNSSVQTSNGSVEISGPSK